MTENNEVEKSELLQVEFFAAKDATGIFMAVPKYSGLKEANIFRVDGLKAFAMKNENILPLDFPDLTEEIRTQLLQLQARGRPLNVGEFMARGLMDAYKLDLVIT